MSNNTDTKRFEDYFRASTIEELIDIGACYNKIFFEKFSDKKKALIVKYANVPYEELKDIKKGLELKPVFTIKDKVKHSIKLDVLNYLIGPTND